MDPTTKAEQTLRHRRPSLHHDGSDAGTSSTHSPSRKFAPTPRRRRSETELPADNSNWFDVPLAFALVPAAGSLLTGSDLLKDFLHLAFLLYYLHNLIKVPWTLYMSARERRPTTAPLGTIDDRTRELARSELRLAELIYLFFTIIAPFLGAFLLRYISKLLSIDTVSTFSTSLFVLATGIRPWRHLIDLLQDRAEALHDVVHLPPDDDVQARVDHLADEVHRLKSLLEAKSVEQASALDLAKKDVKRAERQVETLQASADARLRTLELAVESMQKSNSNLSYGMTIPNHNTAENEVMFNFPRSLAGPLEWLARTPGTGEKLTSGFVEVDDDSGTETETEGKMGTRRYALKEQPAETGLVEILVHLALLPLRLIRSTAALILNQLQ